jgi:hypothetical protein
VCFKASASGYGKKEAMWMWSSVGRSMRLLADTVVCEPEHSSSFVLYDSTIVHIKLIDENSEASF